MNHCYGVAFVLLAYSCALKAGIEQARAWMDETWQLLEARFWEPQHGLYKDEADGQWNFTGYRGQNANMHMCEAMLAAFEASGEQRYVERALQLADNMTRRQAAKAGGLVWEHYDENWEIDWDYNLDDPKHLFRPWGFQPGHQTEWAKLGGYTCNKNVLASQAFLDATPFNPAFATTMGFVMDFWNIPEYAQLLAVTQREFSKFVVEGTGTAQEAMDAIAAEHDKILKETGYIK